MKRMIRAASTLLDLEIDDGMLVNYNGDGGDVVIPNSVTSIGSYAFSDCTRLTRVTIPDSVTSIGKDAFWRCTGLKTITIPDSVTSIGDYAFYHCLGLTSVTMSNSIISIGEYAFSGCSSLTNITIPDSVTEIGEAAFSGCTSLTSITIPDGVTSICDCAFSHCTGLTNVTVPDSVMSIGESAFYNCTRLASITIPDSVTSIGSYAFRGCPGLTSITIPDSVKHIGEKALGSPQDDAQIEYTLNDVLQYLKDSGIDTTKHKYELKAEEYSRGGTGSVYTYRFTALGDWMAYLSMNLHRSMTKSDILDYLSDEIDDLPTTLEGMLEFATENWWGDGDDFIISLKNIDTGAVLYAGNGEDDDYEEDDDWDE